MILFLQWRSWVSPIERWLSTASWRTVLKKNGKNSAMANIFFNTNSAIIANVIYLNGNLEKSIAPFLDFRALCNEVYASTTETSLKISHVVAYSLPCFLCSLHIFLWFHKITKECNRYTVGWNPKKVQFREVSNQKIIAF